MEWRMDFFVSNSKAFFDGINRLFHAHGTCISRTNNTCTTPSTRVTMISVPSPAGPKFVTTVHFQPLKMQRDAAEELFRRRHRSTRVADQKSLSQVAINHPPAFL